MNIKLLLKSIFKETLNVFKNILMVILILGFFSGVLILHELDLLYVWLIRPVVVISGLAFLIFELWVFYNNIKERYKKEIQNKDLEEKEFEVRYKVVYTGLKTVKAKDKSLISLREFDKRNDNEYSEIKIVKVKEM